MLKWGRKGEERFKDYLEEHGVHYSWDDTYEYDFLVSGEHKVDVKTTVRGTEPRDYYDFNIPAYSVDRKVADVYIFCHVNKNEPSSAVLLGWLAAEEFINHPQLIYKESGKVLNEQTGVVVTEPLRSIQYKYLNDMTSFEILL